MAVRTALLGSGSTGAANVTVVAYTCPAGKTAIVKSIYLSNAAGSGSSTILAVHSGGTFVNVFVGTIAVSGVLALDPVWIALEPGDEFVINSNQLNAIKYAISGAELLGVAP